MTAEAIADVIADLRAGRIRIAREIGDTKTALLPRHRAGQALAMTAGEVIDATAIYRSLVERPRPVHLYEDHPCIAPPFAELAICYENEYGNVIAMIGMTFERGCEDWDVLRWDPKVGDVSHYFQDVRAEHEIEWDRVRWVYVTYVWVGGYSKTEHRKIATPIGPVHSWKYAIYEDGEPADIRWQQLVDDYPMEHWDMAACVNLGALQFLNATNVRAVEPARTRGERRRLARTGVTVKTLMVYPTGRAARSKTGEPVGVPLSSVRGHFNHYGDCCPGRHEPRGLAFGRLTGKFWIPDHARGSAEHGEVVKDYQLKPSKGSS